MKRLIKNVLIAFVTITVLLTVLVVLFLNWARNPYGLEEERLGPKGNEKLPPISPIQNAKNYLLFSQYEENNFLIHLPVPNEYIHPSNTSSRLIQSYAVGIRMYYPEMYGGFHPKNRYLLSCNGYCEGYVFANIDVNADGARVRDARTLEAIRKDRATSSPLYRFEDLNSEFGLDDHFQVRYPVIEEKSNGGKYSTKEYFLKRDQNGEVQYLFECSPFNPSPGCSVRFNLSSQPEIMVDILFGRHLMNHWKDIIKSADMRISSWQPQRIDTIREH